jgi:hypothetical protein
LEHQFIHGSVVAERTQFFWDPTWSSNSDRPTKPIRNQMVFVGHADPLHHQRLDMEKHHLCLSHGVFKMLPGEGTQVEQLKNSYGYDLIVEFNIRSSSFHSNAWGYHICRASVIGHKLAPQNFTK